MRLSFVRQLNPRNLSLQRSSMAPIVGQAWVAYVPSSRVVGISKVARLVEVYAKLLQIRKKMTAHSWGLDGSGARLR